MDRLRFTVYLVCVAVTAAAIRCASAQDFPSKPLRIVTSGVGGAGDVTARLIAQGISGALGQQVIVDNRASGIIPVEVVVKAAPDGYTLLLYGNTIWLSPYLQDNVSYDPIKDLAPITNAVTAPNILVVHPSLPAKSVKELIVLAKVRPGELNYAAAGSGSSGHLAAELLKSMAGIDIVRIRYKAAGIALSDLMGGQVQLSFATSGSVAPHVKSGRLRALAVTSLQPSVVFPGLPTVAATGLPGYESGSKSSVFAPAKTPAGVINRLNQEIVRFLHTPEARERFLNIGVETQGSTPEQLALIVKSEMARMGKVIRDAGIRGD